MHVALQTNDVLRLIFSFMNWYIGCRQLGTYDRGLMKPRKRNLLNAAVTTKWWTEPALDALWTGFIDEFHLLKILGLFKSEMVSGCRSCIALGSFSNHSIIGWDNRRLTKWSGSRTMQRRFHGS